MSIDFTEADIESINSDVAALRSSKQIQVAIVNETSIDCPNCVYDPILGEPVGLTCTLCGGSGKITTQTLTQTLPSKLADSVLIDYDAAGSGPNKRKLTLDYPHPTYSFEFGQKVKYENVFYRVTGIDFRGIGPTPNRVIIEVEEVI